MNKLYGLLMVAVVGLPLTLTAEETQPTGPRDIKHRVTGLFSADRVNDLQKVVDSLPSTSPVKIVSIDFDRAEVVFNYDPDQLYGKTEPVKYAERFDNVIGNASRRTFGILLLSEMPDDKLEKVEIPIFGLDCKGCSYAAYLSVFRIDGVERAQASFRDKKVTAWIDPAKTNKAALEESLKQRGVDLNLPTAEPAK
jgi:copper chaperone CopZ